MDTHLIKTILLLLINIYTWVLLVRIVIEMISSFSRNFRPPSWFATIAEPMFVITDPPLKVLRRVIPPLRLGAVALDLSVLALFFGLNLLTYVVSAAL